VFRVLLFAGFAVVSLLQAGCASMWDAVTSRKFRDEPFKTVGRVIVPEDPVLVLRADPPRPGDERARAMHRLKEPIRNNGTQQDQDQIVEILNKAATADSSPVLRFAAIEALGRFADPRAVAILMTAYQNADGNPEAGSPKTPATHTEIVPIGGLSAGRAPTRISGEPFPLSGPTGYSMDVVAMLRCRCLESLGQTHTVEAARFLSAVAGASGPDIAPVGSNEVEIRQAAVRGLGRCRQPEAVVALANVLEKETGKDVTLSRGAHRGLVRLTGQKLPPDPKKWDEVIQAGVTLAPESTWVENVVENAAFWEKK
jgi:HEAT repeats/PBS lyase HEAT-like repeat